MSAGIDAADPTVNLPEALELLHDYSAALLILPGSTPPARCPHLGRFTDISHSTIKQHWLSLLQTRYKHTAAFPGTGGQPHRQVDARLPSCDHQQSCCISNKRSKLEPLPFQVRLLLLLHLQPCCRPASRNSKQALCSIAELQFTASSP